MAVAQKLEKTSGLLFFTGFFLSKFQYVPLLGLSAVFRFGSLGLYFMAYGLWFVANLLRPDHQVQHDEWYSFAQIKKQFLFSSFIGLVATGLSIAAVFVPVLFPPAAFLFLLGNSIWTIGEYHKLKNPPHNDLQYSHIRQSTYVSYAITTSTISLVSAIAAALIFAFPPLAIPVTFFSILLCVGLGALALEYWFKSRLKEHKPMPAAGSYTLLNDTLGPSLAPERTNSPEPNLFNSFSWKQERPSVNIELVTFDHLEKSSDKDNGFTINSSL